ncbi:MAG TPA: GNAT family N-acetyltransferase [Burkholderiaceae bacterium]|nr:GNAT family N-acetyltransferase [Burkholderiaceae bacterium]
MHAPGFAMGDFVAQHVQREDLAELQAFAESNLEYWLLTHGHPPAPDDAVRSFERHPPPDMGYSEHLRLLVRDGSTSEILAQINLATDLMAAGVYHLGFFMTATRTRGTGFAHRLYEAYERWAMDRGARWGRLGVVEANRHAEAFWRRHGYVEVRRQDNYVLGDRSHVLITMVKPMLEETLRDYLRAVPRDRAQ